MGNSNSITTKLPEEDYMVELKKNADAAARLMQDPIVINFLATQRKKTIGAIKALPYEAEHSAYMALKIFLNQLDIFESTLMGHINTFNDKLTSIEFRDGQQ